ncbi:hypothetical protein [Rhodococcus sp. X156]|uniref:hypothetical protein n=1 Tax=Rhodococcus sp. X156 TaxID=2499145 RepID=UPI000FDCD256|nr:hypothetical protein [Rhodococcus sp. X156]
MTAALTVPAGAGEATREERLAALRRLVAVPGKGAGANAAEVSRPRPVLPVPEALAALLPRGGLTRGTVVSVSGATSLLVGLIASVTAAGSWAAVVGRPSLGLLAAQEMGADLGRVALVPEPGEDPVDVAAVLLDGMDLVVLDLGGATVAPTRARGLVARARHRGGVLVVTGGTWPGAELQLRAQVRGCRGLGRGHGRLRSRELAVQVRGRGQAVRARGTHVVLGAGTPSTVQWQGGAPAAAPGPLPPGSVPVRAVRA